MEITPKKAALGAVTLILVSVVGVKGCEFRNARRLKTEAVRMCVVPPTREKGEPYLRGRIAVVNEEKKWDWLIGNYLPEGLAATKPEEISTCVILDWSWRAAGIYNVTTTRGDSKTQSKELAKEQTCHAIIVDLTIPAVVGEADFAGGVSDGYRSDGTGGDPSIGQKPVRELERWLHSLPRKQ